MLINELVDKENNDNVMLLMIPYMKDVVVMTDYKMIVTKTMGPWSKQLQK